MDAKEVNLSKEFVDKISPGTTKLKLPIAGVKKIIADRKSTRLNSSHT